MHRWSKIMNYCSLRKLYISILVTYVLVTWYAAYELLKQSRTDGTTILLTNNTGVLTKRFPGALNQFTSSVRTTARGFDRNQFVQKQVDIWSKAAIGNYLWEHIFESSIEVQSNSYSYGEIEWDEIFFRFYTGPGIIPQSMTAGLGGIILVTNGREPVKIKHATRWLDYISSRSSEFNNTIVVLHGNEECNNSWVMKYMVTANGPVKALFLTYDSPEIDDRTVFQWPLGVATYRSFPVHPIMLHDLSSERRFRCNFLGTVYNNSSRETLLRILEATQLTGECFVKARIKWVPGETAQSMSEYVEVLRSSDLTLNPVGQNAECYRIYEAMSCGSVPVVEDRATSETCGSVSREYRQRVLSLLKRYKAPVVYVSDWSELPALLERERLMTKAQVAARRLNVVQWYSKFRRKMRGVFMNVLRHKFFTS